MKKTLKYKEYTEYSLSFQLSMSYYSIAESRMIVSEKYYSVAYIKTHVFINSLQTLVVEKPGGFVLASWPKANKKKKRFQILTKSNGSGKT